mmetsp:Transcript_5207/g.8055  ORF Transcript_5207/g.8055 Transcript_5207/m.8055 type:complete len:99 (+) Transcript_5207:922-1218(+)
MASLQNHKFIILPSEEKAREAENLDMPLFNIVDVSIAVNKKDLAREKSVNTTRTNKKSGLLELFSNLQKEAIQTLKMRIDRSESVDMNKFAPLNFQQY